MRKTLQKAARGVAYAAAASVVMVAAAAAFLDGAYGRDVILVVPHDATAVEVNRALWTPGEPVADLYGNAAGEPLRVVAPDPARLIVPAEDARLTLLSVDKAAGENPLQVQTVWFVARWTTGGLALVLVVALLVSLRRPRVASAAARRPAPRGV